jgi:hypothetical protein
MEIKTFCKTAIENGYKKSNDCVGWDWIRENLSELDHIFNTNNYRACNGMQYKCMPLLIGTELLSEIEEDILSTAWYLNNDREVKMCREKQRQKMLADGWLLLTADICKQAIENKQKIELAGKITSDWLTAKVEGLYRPMLDRNSNYFLIAPKKRTKGYFLNSLINCGETDCFCKLTA